MENRNKYFAIRNYLLSQNVESLLLSIEEIEGILGFELPSTAITNNEWWRWSPNSDSHPHAKNWNTIGWEAKLNTRQQTVLFSNTNYISDSELKRLNLSISEYEFYKDYPRRYVSKINLSVDDWINLLNPDQQIFTEDNISFLKRIYLSPNHATTCYSLAILEESSPNAYNFPMVALAKRIINQLSLSPLYGEDGLPTYWRYLFWGRYVDNHKHFEWLLRPELLIALKTLYPDLSKQKGNEYLDFQIQEEIATSSIPEKLELELETPKEKVDTVIINSHEGYPRSRNVAYTALQLSNYNCEFDNSHESFKNKSTGRKYLETHHLIPLAYYKEFDNSLDHIANVVCLCSECHNRIHYGADAKTLITKLYNERKEQLSKAGILITLEKLLEMYNC